MKKTPLLLFAALAAQLTITSCGKDEDKTATPTPTPTPTNKELLIGTWKVTNYADDSNKNNTMDNAEIYPPDATEEFRFSFKNDGTGVAYQRYDKDSNTVNYKWYMSDDKKVLLLPLPDPEDSTYFTIDKISTTDLILRDENSTLYDSWIIFKKQ